MFHGLRSVFRHWIISFYYLLAKEVHKSNFFRNFIWCSQVLLENTSGIWRTISLCATMIFFFWCTLILDMSFLPVLWAKKFSLLSLCLSCSTLWSILSVPFLVLYVFHELEELEHIGIPLTYQQHKNILHFPFPSLKNSLIFWVVSNLTTWKCWTNVFEGVCSETTATFSGNGIK